MRLSLALAFTILPLAVQADTIEAQSRVVSVTLYPWGANVVRRVEFTAPAGVHDLIVPDLPANSPASALRIASDEDVKVGAVNLATGRFPVPEVEPSDAVQAAEAEVERLEAELRDRQAGIAAIRLRVEAANEQWAFLRSLGQGQLTGEQAGTVDPEALRGLARMIGEETLAARQEAHTAEQEAQAAERALEDLNEDLAAAREALAALTTDGADRAVLSMAVESASDGLHSVDITTFVNTASWRPVYDLRLSRDGDPSLIVERSVLVSQASGEDWTDVGLTLSTARPSERNAPSQLFGNLLRIIPEGGEALERFGRSFALDEAVAPEPAMEAVTVAQSAVAEMQGATVVYRYGNLVDIRDGVEDLRLSLDDLTLEPQVAAIAVPSRDTVAYLVSEIENTSGEVILPGDAYLYLDGTFVGQAALPLIADGADTAVGFGAIDGIRLTRTVPDRTGGERGLLSSRNQIDEVAVLKIENLTEEVWPLLVFDQVPYSEQDDLEITYSASPAPTETNADGRRGVLEWEFDLGAGETREIRLNHSITWPDGYVLQ